MTSGHPLIDMFSQIGSNVGAGLSSGLALKYQREQDAIERARQAEADQRAAALFSLQKTKLERDQAAEAAGKLQAEGLAAYRAGDLKTAYERSRRYQTLHGQSVGENRAGTALTGSAREVDLTPSSVPTPSEVANPWGARPKLGLGNALQHRLGDVAGVLSQQIGAPQEPAPAPDSLGYAAANPLAGKRTVVDPVNFQQLTDAQKAVIRANLGNPQGERKQYTAGSIVGHEDPLTGEFVIDKSIPNEYKLTGDQQYDLKKEDIEVKLKKIESLEAQLGRKLSMQERLTVMRGDQALELEGVRQEGRETIEGVKQDGRKEVLGIKFDRADRGAYQTAIAHLRQKYPELVVTSGERTTAEQTALWNEAVKKHGVAKAAEYVARPGHGSHEHGVGMDFASIKDPKRRAAVIADAQAMGLRVRNNYGDGHLHIDLPHGSQVAALPKFDPNPKPTAAEVKAQPKPMTRAEAESKALADLKKDERFAPSKFSGKMDAATVTAYEAEKQRLIQQYMRGANGNPVADALKAAAENGAFK